MNLAKRIREDVENRGLEIAPVRIRRSIEGGLVYKLLGNNAAERAEILLSEIRSSIQEHPEIRIMQVDKKAELIIYGFIEKTSPDEIMRIISKEYKCRTDSIRCGQIRYNRKGEGSIRIKCPVTTALRILESDRVNIGWSAATVRLINENYQLRCYKCWRYGHMSYNCPEKNDRRDSCFRCGAPGQNVECDRPSNCPVCTNKNVRSDYIAGGPEYRTIVLRFHTRRRELGVRNYVGDYSRREIDTYQ
jgi:hypothetical protein